MAVELTLDDITDLPAYERERQDFRPFVIALKKRRRIQLGTIVSLVFENRDTIRFQIQEMARVERIATDEGIETELRTYNPLISRPGKLSATLFIELTTRDQLGEWLPRLAGIERRLELHLGEGAQLETVPNQLDDQHEASLTRSGVTSTVHYVWWPLTPGQTDRLGAGPARIVCTHPAYAESMLLSDENRRAIMADLR